MLVPGTVQTLTKNAGQQRFQLYATDADNKKEDTKCVPRKLN